MKTLILTVLALILLSLASGVFFLARDDAKSRRVAVSLTIRIALSILLFLLLIVSYFSGALQPHHL